MGSLRYQFCFYIFRSKYRTLKAFYMKWPIPSPQKSALLQGKRYTQCLLGEQRAILSFFDLRWNVASHSLIERGPVVWSPMTKKSIIQLKTPTLHYSVELTFNASTLHDPIWRAGDRGFSPDTKRVAPGYFYWKIEVLVVFTRQLEILVTTLWRTTIICTSLVKTVHAWRILFNTWLLLQPSAFFSLARKRS